MGKQLTSKDELVGWAYVRVSTPDQRNVLHGSVEQQLNRIKRWQAEQSAKTGIKHRITRYIDEDISGRVESLHKRSEFHDLMRAIKNQLIDFVVIEKLDRLHRNQVESRKFIDLCDANGVKFYRLDGGLVDLKDRSSRTSVFIESWIAEEYSLDLVEKITKKGREARVNNGKDNNSLPILGLDEHPTEACFYIINKEEQKIVTDIFRHFCACGDLQQTVNYCEKKGYRTKQRYTRPKVEEGKKVPAKLVGGMPFDRKSLRALLVNRKIAGFGYFKDDWNQFPQLQDENGMVMWKFRHGPVVSPNLFETAQEILRHNAKYNHRIYQDQRTYFLSGILFDRDGNKLRGESAKKKSNIYYINPAKKYRIQADKIEKTVVSFVSSLLEKNGILDKAITNFFHGKNSGLEKLETEISQNSSEIKQCERLLDVLASKGRDRILANPEQMEELLLEGIELRKQTQARLDELHDESRALNLQKEQLYKFKDKTSVQSHIKKALKLFETSSSKRKQRLIQLMVPKLVLDEKQDQLFLFINPFLENSCKNSIEKIDDFEAILPQSLIQSENERFVQVPESSVEILSQRGKNVRVAEEWRGGRDSNPRPPA